MTTAEVKAGQSLHKTYMPLASHLLSLQVLLQPLQLEKALMLTAKIKAKAKHFVRGDLLYHRTPGTEAFQQVPMMEKEMAKEKYQKGDKGKGGLQPPWWQSWQVDQTTGIWHWYEDPYWHADTQWHWHADLNRQDDQEPQVFRYHTHHRGWH